MRRFIFQKRALISLPTSSFHEPKAPIPLSRLPTMARLTPRSQVAELQSQIPSLIQGLDVVDLGGEREVTGLAHRRDGELVEAEALPG